MCPVPRLRLTCACVLPRSHCQTLCSELMCCGLAPMPTVSYLKQASEMRGASARRGGRQDTSHHTAETREAERANTQMRRGCKGRGSRAPHHAPQFTSRPPRRPPGRACEVSAMSPSSLPSVSLPFRLPFCPCAFECEWPICASPSSHLDLLTFLTVSINSSGILTGARASASRILARPRRGFLVRQVRVLALM